MGLQEIHEHEALGGGSGRRLHCRLTSLSRSLQINLRINLDGTCWYNEILSIGFRFSDKKRSVAPDKTGMRTPDTNTAILPIFNFDFGLDGFVNGYSSAD